MLLPTFATKGWGVAAPWICVFPTEFLCEIVHGYCKMGFYRLSLAFDVAEPLSWGTSILRFNRLALRGYLGAARYTPY